ncbi:MAG: hypothetical protein HY849_02690 [Nitrosomonadales bacterium]|nr:hypothetical protein [Nitrosomonadales bacterium]
MPTSSFAGDAPVSGVIADGKVKEWLDDGRGCEFIRFESDRLSGKT